MCNSNRLSKENREWNININAVALFRDVSPCDSSVHQGIYCGSTNPSRLKEIAKELAKTFDAMKPNSYYSIHCIAINPDDFIAEKKDWQR